MALVKLKDQRYVINYSGVKTFTAGTHLQASRNARKSVDLARKIAAELRAAGIGATATSDFGDSIEQAAAMSVAEPPAASHRGVSPIKVRENLYKVEWTIGDGTFAITGRTPDEVLQKVFDAQIQAGSAELRSFIAALPPEVAVAPAAPADAVPAETTEGRVLRPGNLRDEPQLAPERRLTEAPRTRDAEFADWYRTAPAAAAKERYKTDSEFHSWIDR